MISLTPRILVRVPGTDQFSGRMRLGRGPLPDHLLIRPIPTLVSRPAVLSHGSPPKRDQIEGSKDSTTACKTKGCTRMRVDALNGGCFGRSSLPPSKGRCATPFCSTAFQAVESRARCPCYKKPFSLMLRLPPIAISTPRMSFRTIRADLRSRRCTFTPPRRAPRFYSAPHTRTLYLFPRPRGLAAGFLRSCSIGARPGSGGSRPDRTSRRWLV